MLDKLSETHIVGADTFQQIVRADECPALAQRQISHVGVGDAAVPYRIVRTNLSGAYLHACLGGEGRMLIDGRWRIHGRGMVTLAPPHVLHAFHAVLGKRWQYCWVRYMPGSPRFASTSMTRLVANFDARPLQSAIMGLYCEMESTKDPISAARWIDLIEHYVTRFTEPLQREERLSAVWETVEADLGHQWTLEVLAEMAGMSGEHLRRLCQSSLGRSPMQQLMHLRIQQAARVLATTDMRVEDVAFAVGYQNPFAFSNTFKRITGFRPSRYQLHRRGRIATDADT